MNALPLFFTIFFFAITSMVSSNAWAGPMGYPTKDSVIIQSQPSYSSSRYQYSPYRQYEDIRRYNTAPCSKEFSQKNYNNKRSHNHCATGPYQVCTKEVSRCQRAHSYLDRCGNKVNTTATIITYRSVYSDGSSRTYTRTLPHY